MALGSDLHRRSASAGTHSVMFLKDDASEKKIVTVTCAVGERKTVVVKLTP